MISLLSNKLKLQLGNTASDLLMKILDEPSSKKLTKTEEDFFDVIISLSEISPAYKFLADAYLNLYNSIHEEKISNPEFIEEIKTKYPINWELFS
jgi:hypothetical protein